MSFKYIFLSVLILTGSYAFAQQNVPREYTSFEKAFHEISSNEIKGFVDEMCKPENKGRLSGSPEFTRCAHWAANYFSSWGLLPGGDNGFYFQNFPIQYTNVKNSGLLRVTGEDLDLTYSPAKDYYPGTHTASGYIKSEVVYVGFGITSPEYLYDDYGKTDVSGKIVIIEPGVPCEKTNKNYSKWEELYSGTIYKMENAYKHGASGVLFTGKFSHPGIIHHDNFIYCHVIDKVVNDLLSRTGYTVSSLKKQIRTFEKPCSFKIKDVNVEMMFDSFHVNESQTQNVIGYIPGSDDKLKDSPIIVGAHLDHLGDPGVLFPGALDNASGSAIVLETAKAFALSGIKPIRPVVFILFGAEEWGMLGSKYYVKHPLFPLEKTLCMFNLDMVGNGTGLRVGGVDDFPELKANFEMVNEQYLKRILVTSSYEKAQGKMYTDGEIFNFNDVFAFSLGTCKKVSKTYYHVPEDLPETLTPEIMEDVSKLLFLTLSKISCDNTFNLK